MSQTDLDDDFNLPDEPEAAATREDVVAALSFSAPREVQTKRGPRLVSKAKPSPEFYKLWEVDERWLRERGLVLGSFRGEVSVTKWENLPEKVVVERKAAIEMSRATDASINAPCPDGLAYLGYQRAGIAFGMTREALLIGDEMGLGKTIQAIGVLNCSPDLRRVLVICPASLKLNWKREIERWTTVRRPVFVADSKFLPEIDGVVVVNYDVLHKHEEILQKTVWDVLICDEAHYLKNAKARRSSMVFGVRATGKQREAGVPDVPGIRAKKKIFLTGTPIANKPAELFPLISYLDPIAWPDFFRYAVRYCNGHRRQFSSTKSGWDFSGASNLEELQDKLRSSIMIRRLKKDVLTDLPPKRRQVIELSPDPTSRAALRAELDAFQGRAENQVAALEAEAEVAIAADDAEAYRCAVSKLEAGASAAFSEISALRLETARAKIPVALEFIREAAEESGKIVVFAHHKEVVRALAKEFGEEAVLLVGDTPMVERQEAVDRFQQDPSVRVFIGSIMAAGVGITLTAAAHVIFFELDWVPGNVSQAEDRCHRIGQKESVLVQHLVLEGSLDAIMARKIVAKQNVIDRALDRVKVQADDPRERERIARRQDLEERAASMTTDAAAAASDALRYISSQCNGAKDWDGVGFSKLDTGIGKSLASQRNLTPKQAALAGRLAWKYRRQLPGDLVDRLRATFEKHES